MSDATDLLGLIFDLIPALKSLTGERRRDCFNQILDPMFEQLEQVHDYYNEIILKARRDIGELYAVQPSPGGGEAATLSREDQQKLSAIKRDFENARKVDESLRTSLRHEAGDILSKLKWTEERRFLVSVIYYFLDDGALAPTDKQLDQAIADIIFQGGNTYLDTPSMRLYRKLAPCMDLMEIIELLDESRDNLNQKHMNARRCFKGVQGKIVLEK